jgi:hypothetical protein
VAESDGAFATKPPPHSLSNRWSFLLELLSLDYIGGRHSLFAAKRNSNIKMLSGMQPYYNRWNAAK